MLSPDHGVLARARWLVIGFVALASVLPAGTASAQSLFDFFFGGGRTAPPPVASPYADPNAPPADPAPRVGSTYCVRLCDGRFFPVQRATGMNAAQVCNASCPAARTRLYSGGAIEYAVANDGSRYKDLPSAFAYRDRTVAGCTCNGKDPYGLVTGDVSDDPSLRPGDIVATEQGFVAYNGGVAAGGRRQSEFTPIESYGGLSAELRGRLAGAKIVPRNAIEVSGPEHTAGARGRRVQADR